MAKSQEPQRRVTPHVSTEPWPRFSNGDARSSYSAANAAAFALATPGPDRGGGDDQ